MSKTIASMNKTELAMLVRAQAEELVNLRTQLSELSVLVKTNSQRGKSASSGQRPVRVTEYADHATAAAKCKELAASEWNTKWSFAVSDNKVTAAARKW